MSSGRYSLGGHIPVDSLAKGAVSVTRKATTPGGDMLDQLMAAVESLREEVQQSRDEAEEYRAQVSNQLSELIARTGKIERAMADGAPVSSRNPTLVTDEEAMVKGAKFWIVTFTGGIRTPHEVVVTGQVKDLETGRVGYQFRRIDGVTQGPQAPRPVDQLFRSREDAMTAPRAKQSARRPKSIAPSG